MKLRASEMKKTVFALLFFLFCVPALCPAQEFPTKPINVLIAVNPGGSNDSMVRLIGHKAEKFLGQPFMITNNGGAAGSVALGIVAKQPPDGYHLAGHFSTPLILVPHYRTVPYKLDDFTPIIIYGASTLGLVVKADSPWKTLKELVEHARKNPGDINYSVLGTGAPQHLAMEYIAKQEGIRWTAVPYSSGLPTIPLLGGHVTATSTGTEWTPHVQAGTLRLLATYGETRTKTFPNVPTLRELGYDYVAWSVYTISAPKGTPSPIIKKL